MTNNLKANCILWIQTWQARQTVLQHHWLHYHVSYVTAELLERQPLGRDSMLTARLPHCRHTQTHTLRQTQAQTFNLHTQRYMQTLID